MANINMGKVVLGGLVAGVVLNIGEALLNTVVLAKAMEEDFRRLNLPPQPSGTFIAKAVVMTFLLGIVIVYLYAAIRPRFGAGVIAWFFAYVYVGVIQVALGLFSVQPFMIGLVWGLVEFAAGAVAGAWFYKEEA